MQKKEKEKEKRKKNQWSYYKLFFPRWTSVFQEEVSIDSTERAVFRSNSAGSACDPFGLYTQ